MKFGYHDDTLLKAKQPIIEIEGSSVRSNLSQIFKIRERLINGGKSEPKNSLLSSVLQNFNKNKDDDITERTNTENKAKRNTALKRRIWISLRMINLFHSSTSKLTLIITINHQLGNIITVLALLEKS